MLYCTYDEYQAAGGTVPEAAFGEQGWMRYAFF